MKDKDILKLFSWAHTEVYANNANFASALFRCCLVLMPDNWGAAEFKKLFKEAAKEEK